MKLKIVVLDLELTSRQKRIAAFLLVPAIVFGGGAIAYANVLHTWNDGDTLTAADLNGNFDTLNGSLDTVNSSVAALDTRITKLEGSAAANPSAFRAHLSGTVAVPSSGIGVSHVLFDQVNYDLGAEYNPGTGNFTAKQAGVYMATCQYDAGNLPNPGGGETDIVIYKNNGSGATNQVIASGSQVMNVPSKVVFVEGTVQLAQGETLNCGFIQTIQGSLAVGNASYPENTNFSVTRLY